MKKLDDFDYNTFDELEYLIRYKNSRVLRRSADFLREYCLYKMTIREIAEKHDLSRERVRQCLEVINRRLKYYTKNK